MLVYTITNKHTKKTYVGVTHGTNFKNYWGSGIHISRAIKKHGRGMFEKKILEKVSTKEDAFARERYWIKELNTLHPNGHNLSSGGGGLWQPCALVLRRMREINTGKNNPQYGVSPSESTRKKLSDTLKNRPPWNKGKKLSSAIRKNMSRAMTGKGNSFYGRTHTEETKRKIAESRKLYVGEKHFRFGKKLTEEHKRKIRLTWIRKRAEQQIKNAH